MTLRSSLTKRNGAEHKRRQVIAVLTELIRQDPRFVRGTTGLVPAHDPSGNRIIPATHVLLLARLARAMRLESLRAPWLLLDRAMVQSAAQADVELAHVPQALRDQVEWFYSHFSRGQSRLRIADEAGYSEDTVRLRLREVRKVLDVHQRRGRPARFPHIN